MINPANAVVIFQGIPFILQVVPRAGRYFDQCLRIVATDKLESGPQKVIIGDFPILGIPFGLLVFINYFIAIFSYFRNVLVVFLFVSLYKVMPCYLLISIFDVIGSFKVFEVPQKIIVGIFVQPVKFGQPGKVVQEMKGIIFFPARPVGKKLNGLVVHAV